MTIPHEVITIISRQLGAHRFRADERNRAIAEDLHSAGLLAGGTPTANVPVHQAAINIMQCRMEHWDAEAIADGLASAGMLATDKENAR